MVAVILSKILRHPVLRKAFNIVHTRISITIFLYTYLMDGTSHSEKHCPEAVKGRF